ncbi:hypothetical protein [Mesobaculum littorinae]|nr:hypothetical protein [Mesobaculum littorinae]
MGMAIIGAIRVRPGLVPKTGFAALAVGALVQARRAAGSGARG